MTLSRRDFFGGLLSTACVAWTRRTCGAQAGEPLLRFGFASDTHLAFGDDPRQLGRVFDWFHDRNVDAVVLSGDITEGGFDDEIDFLMEIWNTAFPQGVAADGRTVERFWVWGNHDYKDASYMRNLPPARKAEDLRISMFAHKDATWRKMFGEPFPGEVFHKTIRGFSFVGAHWGHEDETGAYLKAHAKDIDTSKLFFHVQHPHPPRTVYSPGQTDKSILRNDLSRHSNCFSLSGHGHESAAYESALWQGAFTALGGSSTKSPGALTPRENGGWVPRMQTPRPVTPAVDAGRGSHAMIVSVYAHELVVERHEFVYDEPLGEEWVLPLPLETHPDAPCVIAARADAPQFAGDAKLVVERCKAKTRQNETTEVCRVAFPPAIPAKRHGRVTDYRVDVRDGEGGPVAVTRLLMQPKLTLAERRLGAGTTISCLIPCAEIAGVSDPVFTVKPLNAGGKGGAPLISRLN